MDTETYIIAKGSHGSLKSTRKLLQASGISAEIVQPPGEDLNK